MVSTQIIMYRLVVVLALVASCLALPHRSGLAPRLDGRIVGGQDTTIQENPHQISLTSWGSHICGGSIINANTILSAAHCTQGAVAQYGIRAGSTFRTSGGVTISVTTLWNHPSYNSANLDFDYSVLRLASSLSFGSGIAAIGLHASGATLGAGTPSVVTGWGTLWSGGPSPDVLQTVTVPIISNADCSAAYAGFNVVTDRMICAGLLGVGGQDACQGDSGGPQVANGVLVGVVSWGRGCAEPAWPGVYARVAAVRPWIDGLM